MNYEFDHDVSADLDYGFNWSSGGWLQAGETIVESVWTNTEGIIKGDEFNNGTITSAFYSGATEGGIYKLTNTVTTSLGRTDSRTITLSVKRR